jgi:hypothetical protein
MAASSRTRSGPNAPFECVHRDRLIAPTKREASPRLSPAAAAVMIHTAQDGKLSITDVPPSHWQGHIQPRTVNKLLMLSGLPVEPAGAIPSRSTRRRDEDFLNGFEKHSRGMPLIAAAEVPTALITAGDLRRPDRAS